MKRSTEEKKTIFTAEMMYKVLGHPAPKVIQHVEELTRNVTIDHGVPALTAIECEICAVSKPTKLISRRNDTEEWFKGAGVM